ncbi:MAG: hypothetical protein ACM3JL_00650 [Nitrososphaerota archaeon]
MTQPDDDRGGRLDHRLVHAVAQPLRADLLRLLAERGPLSAPEAHALLQSGAELDRLVYQARILADLGLVESTESRDHGRAPTLSLTAAGRTAAALIGVASPEEE